MANTTQRRSFGTMSRRSFMRLAGVTSAALALTSQRRRRRLPKSTTAERLRRRTACSVFARCAAGAARWNAACG